MLSPVTTNNYVGYMWLLLISQTIIIFYVLFFIHRMQFSSRRTMILFKLLVFNENNRICKIVVINLWDGQFWRESFPRVLIKQAVTVEQKFSRIQPTPTMAKGRKKGELQKRKHAKISRYSLITCRNHVFFWEQSVIIGRNQK